MNKKLLAYYDITGIQDFIFLSKKLKENIGASYIIRKLFDVEELKNKMKLDFINENFDQNTDFGKGKIIFSGGGNLLLIFNNKEDAIEFTKKLSNEFYNETYGLLSFSVSYVDTDFTDYQQDYEKLLEESNILKNNLPKSKPLLGISITREGVTDNLPAVKNYEGEYISKPALLMREANNKKPFEKLFEKVLDGHLFLEDIEKMRSKKDEESHLAYIHIDGNSMGMFIKKMVMKTKSYKDAVNMVKKLSNEINRRYIEAFSETLEKLKNNENFLLNEDKRVIKIRPIVFSGDDITIICEGKYGLSLAEDILKNISQKPIEIDGEKTYLTASAGVALVKAHFPFYKAYEITEELCKSAKNKGKKIAKEMNLQDVGNWIDFHIVYSGISKDLKKLRKKNYSVPGMDEPASNKIYDSFNLLWRPWYVGNEQKLNEYNFEHFKKMIYEFDSISMNKVKKLRSYLIKSKEDAESFIEFLKSRRISLPEFKGSRDLFRENKTPYFDSIEFIRMFEDINKE